MAIPIANTRKSLATSYGTYSPYVGAATSTGPGTSGSATNEVAYSSGGRAAASWGAATDNGTVASIVGTGSALNIPASTTVTYAFVAASATAGTADVHDEVAITSQTFASAGVLTLTPTYTQA